MPYGNPEPVTLTVAGLAAAAPIMIVAPHPDDESIGCGGLLALLHDCSFVTSVLLLSDGSASHPASRHFSADDRKRLRRREMLQALSVLGLGPRHLDALDLRDGEIPMPGAADFEPAVRGVASCLARRRPRTLVLPWRRDPHPDHRAGNVLVRAANAQRSAPAIEIEYPVWLEERGSPQDKLQRDEGVAYRIDISAALPRKLAAVAAHRSQRGLIIDDDPSGFSLSAEMLSRCATPCEIYYRIHMIRDGA